VRIAFVVHGYPPDESAGVELVAREQAHALAERGHAIAVFARSYAGDPHPRCEADGAVAVWRVGAPAGAIADFASTWDNHVFDAAFGRFLDETRPGVVHFQHTVMLSPNLVEVARRRGLPTVLTLHDAWHLCQRLYLLDRDGRRCPGPDEGARCEECLADLGGRSVARARFDFMARSLDAIDLLLAPSHAVAARHEAQWPFLAGRIAVADPGLPGAPGPVEPLVARTLGQGRPGDPLRLLFAGTWLPHKGLDLLVRSVGRLDPARFTLAIHGAGVAGRESFVEDLRGASQGLPVEWRGTYPPERLGEVLAAADVLVLPSRCDESYSRIVREARSAGLAVVAPSTGGPGEALRDDVDALLVEPGSQEALDQALARLLDDPSLVRRLASAPARWPTVAEAAARLEEEYLRLVARAAERAANAPVGTIEGGPRHGPAVSIVYVTKNGADFLDASLAAVRRQRGAFDLLEIVAVDSGSSDATPAILERHGARLLRITPQEFGHGRTRNLGARAVRGDVVVFLTQDAEPADEVWLDRLVAPFADDPMIAGTWSRHVPRPGCHPMESRRVEEFPLFREGALVVSSLRRGTVDRHGPEMAVWFSNNASAIRRGILERFPFPEVEFAEDQAWAGQVLEAGFRTALANESVILHSHDYGPWVNLQRHFDHARAMRETMGREDGLTLREALRQSVHETGRDVDFWATRRDRGRLRVFARWGGPSLAYHLGAFGGRWLGARAGRLPDRWRRRLSLHHHRRNDGLRPARDESAETS